MAFLPMDIVSDILLRLPVKPLLRLRSVSKIWCALIDSDHFIKLHLHRSIDTKTHRQIIRKTNSTDLVDTISLDSLDVAGKQLDYPLVPEKLHVAGKKGHTYYGLVSCNGLVLEWASSYGDETVIIAISNPSTRKCLTLPPSQDKLDSYCSRFKVYRLAFGYDAVNDDYKVVKLNYIKLFYRDVFKWDVQVYSLKSNAWRTIEDFPYEICWLQAPSGVLAHGAFHFFLDTNPEEEHHFGSMLAFDLVTEETRLLPLPDFGGGGNKVCKDLVALEGSLCIFAYEHIDSYDRKFLGAWVMKGYGVGGSWHKLLSPAHLSVIGSFHKVVPLAYSKNGREVLLLRDYKEFIWFDLENTAARKVQVCSLSSTFKLIFLFRALYRLVMEEKLTRRSRTYEIRTKTGKRSLESRGKKIEMHGLGSKHRCFWEVAHRDLVLCECFQDAAKLS